jgi:ribokinase
MAKKRKAKNKKAKYDVIAVGSATIDCFVNLPVDFRNIRHGSKLLIEDIKLLTGGGATNVAVGLRRLGLKVGFIGEVGDDHSAYIVRRDLEKEGVDFLVKQHSRHETAYSVILESMGKDRAILVYKGASSYLHPEEVRSINKDAAWFYFSSMMGASLKTLNTLANYAKRNRIRVFFNPSSYTIERCRKEMDNILSATTIISVNKEEAQALLGSRSDRPEELLKGMKALGPEVCIMTDGENGAYAFDGTSFVHQEASRIRIVDTTGAGDSFNSGFLGGYLINKRLNDDKRLRAAMKMGAANAKSVISHVGAKTGLLTRRKMLRC